MIVNPGAGGGQGGAAARHAQNHASGGTDPLTPAAIGAAAASHSHTAVEIGAAAGHTHTPESIGAAEKNHSHTAAGVGARPDSWMPSAADVGAVPVERKINGKGLDADVSLSASDVGAAAADHTHSAYAPVVHSHEPAQIGAAAANHTHTPAGIGAAAADHSHTPASIGAAATNHSHSEYLPIAGGTVTGNLTLKGSGNFGTQLNFGDGDYVHIGEPTDDCLEIKAKKINFMVSDTTDARFTLNGEKIGGGSGTAVEPGTAAPLAAGTATVGTSAKFAREDHRHPAQTTVSGNAGTATKLATARTIDGMSFDGSANVTHYATCSTAAATAAKAASKSGFTLATGARIAVKFTYANTAASPTLNVNSTGAKAIAKYGSTAAGSGAWGAGEVVEFVYDGTRFLMVDGAAREKAMSGGSSDSDKPTRITKTVSSGASTSITVVASAGYLVMVDGFGMALVNTEINGVQNLLSSSNGNLTAEMTSSTNLKLSNNGLSGSNPAFVDVYKIW